MIKKTILYIMIIGAFISTKAQNDSIGIYPIYEANNEYYLLTGNDTSLLDICSLTIKFKEHVTAPDKDSFKSDYNLTYIRETIGNYVGYKISNSSNYIDVCDSIYYDSRIDEFIFSCIIGFYGFEPDDPDVIDQWYLDQIDVKDAWNITMGSEEIIVAVIDEGLFIGHEDIGDEDEIRENIFHNAGEDEWSIWDNPNTGNKDDDFDNDPSTFIDDWKGWNYGNFDPDAIPPEFIEDNNVIPEKDWGYHGTAISGIISATTNNGNDMAGIAGGNYAENVGGVKILPIKISDYKWDIYFQEWLYWPSSINVAPAIIYAVDMGADVISLAIKMNFSQVTVNAIEAAFDYAYAHDVLIVAAAGNEGYPNTITFPANYDKVIAVGASDQDDEDAEFSFGGASNHGDELDIVAPGVDILTLDNTYTDYMEGTSMAAPMVSATAALMLSIKPDLTNTQIREILINTAEKVGSHSYDQNGWNKYMGYGRLNTYYAVCEVLKLLDPITVITSDTWDEPVYSLHDIVVETDKTLTITSTVSMGNDARFIIKPGATVILDGGTLTNYKFCGHEDNKWPGVEVWGNENESQYINPNDGIQHQGKLIINDGVIENAVIAVRLSKGSTWTASTGGIVQANGAVFRNNARSLLALNYRNYSPGYPSHTLDNASYFNYCTFTVNNEYMPDVTFFKHIDMNNVDGIKFKACPFSLEGGVAGVSPYNKAIQSNNAGFDVMAICTSPPGQECTSYDKCTFTGFNRAIAATNTNSIYTFWVNRAVFNNNATGIYASNVQNLSVLFSKFNIAKNTANEQECDAKGQKSSGYGIDLLGCTGFAIEENHFAPGSTGGLFTGIRCKDSHTEYDIIYNNIFDGLSYGNFAEGMNRDIINDAHGLEYRCNHNSDNSVDFQVDTDDPYNSPAMIRGYMGYTNISAGNTFSQQSGVDWHFLNLGTQQIDYWWFSGNPTEEPEYYCTPPPNPYPDPCYFTPYSISTENNCPSHYGGGGSGTGQKSVSLTPGQFQETEQEYLAALNDFNNVKTLYDNLQDGGNTQILNSEIETAFPSDMWQLRSELLGVSPHVSKEVLMTTADKTDVFPESVLFEILSANPDELKNGDMISFLENKEQPLPEYMIDMLKQIAGGVTYKTILKRQLADFHAKKSKAAQDIVRSILADSVMDMQLYRNWLDNLGGLGADKQIVASYVQEGDYASAQTLLGLIPSIYGLSGDRLEQYNDYKSLTEFQMGIAQQNRNIMELENNEINFLVDLAENSNGTAKVVARGILSFGYEYNYCDCMPSDSSALKSSAIDFDKPAIETGLGINAKPNPADSWVAFEFSLPSYIGEAVLRITDIEGREITRFSIDSEKGQKIWDIRKIDSGVYFYTLDAGDIQKTDKLIIK